MSDGGRASFYIPAGSSPNTYSCSPLRCHNIMRSIVSVPIRYTASPLGQAMSRVTHELGIPPDMGFGSSAHSRRPAGSCVPLLQWPFDIPHGQFFFGKRHSSETSSFWGSCGRPQQVRFEDRSFDPVGQWFNLFGKVAVQL